MATNTLDPQLLAQILGLQNDPQFSRGMDSNHVTRYIAPEGNALADYQLVNRQQQQFAGPNEEGAWSPGKNYIYKDIKQNGLIDIFDDKGNFLSREKGANPGNELMTAIALMAGGYFGGGALADAYGAAGAGAGAGGAAGGTGGIDLVAGSGLGADTGTLVGGSTLTSGGGGLGALEGVGGAGLGGGAAAGGGSSLGSLGSVGSALGSAGSFLGSNASTLGGLAGAVAGAIDSKDKTQTSSRDPWAPAQDFLKQRLADGGELAAQYKAQPFSPAQQTAYGNVGGILDMVNGQLPGLLAGMNANASGQNQFVRGQRPTLTGSTFNPAAFQPAGLLGYMGSK